MRQTSVCKGENRGWWDMLRQQPSESDRTGTDHGEWKNINRWISALVYMIGLEAQELCYTGLPVGATNSQPAQSGPAISTSIGNGE
ncbi:unnamed protein product [Dicrocoelium dendriticum]|nr:unnamed protein product [Dicrocoelium dendriticum]